MNSHSLVYPFLNIDLGQTSQVKTGKPSQVKKEIPFPCILIFKIYNYEKEPYKFKNLIYTIF